MLEKNSTGELFLSIFLAIAIILISGLVYVQGDLTTYMTAPMSIADKGLFANDFSVQEFLRPNPQSFSDYLSALFLKLGVSWQALSIAGYLLQTAVFAAGIIAISRHICGGKNYWLMSSLLLLLSIYAVSGLRIGRNPIWYGSFYYAQSGFAVGVWGFYLSLKKKWVGAFSLFGLATLLHFTAGSYCAAFALVFLIIDSVKNKKYKQLWAPGIWIAVCVGIYVMMYVAGTTSTGLLSADQFVKIHAYLRHPHHHVPTSWEPLEWVNFACYIGGVFLVLRAVLKEDSQKKFLMGFFYVTTAMTALILVFNILFIEIIPVAFVAKIQPARSVFIYRFFLAGLLAYSAVKLYQKKSYMLAAALIFATCLPQIEIKTYSGILTLVCGLGIFLYAWGDRKSSPLLKTIGMLGAVVTAIAVLWLPFGNILILIAISTIIGLMMLIALGGVYAELQGNFRRRLITIAVMVLFTGAVYMVPFIDISGKFEGIGIKSMANQYTLVSNDIHDLAVEFKEKTDRDALFLGDPFKIETSYFRLYSERSSVIAFKNMPFTDEGMLEWVDRLEKMGGVTVGDDGYYQKNDRAFARMEPADVLEYAKGYHAGYLFLFNDQVKTDKYLELGCSMFISNDAWVVLQIND